ncbi:hypothetical protein AAC387_Pa04g0288 [Persea americana]
MSIGNGKALRLHSDTDAASPLSAWALSSAPRGGKLAVGPLPPPSSAVKLQLPAFLRSEGRKTGSCSFTAALIGGKVDFPVFLLSERRKAGNCTFTAALIGGKVDFPVFLRSEGRKTGNCGYAAGTYGAYILKSLEVKFSTRQVPKSACVIFPSPFISYGSSLDIGYEKKRKYRFFHSILCQLEMERPCDFIRTLTRLHRCLHGRCNCQLSSAPRGGKLAVGPLPPPSSAVKLQLPAFLRSEGRKTGSCSFTAALIGGKVDFPVFLLSERRKAGNCTFTAALIGGKVDFPVFLRSEGRKTGNCGYAAGTYGVGPLPPPSSAVKLQLPAFLRSEGRKTGSCSFTAALIGGKVDFPVFLLSKRRKAGNCTFTAALIGGKVDFPVFLRSEGRKTGNCGYAAGTYGGNISIPFFILSSLLLLAGGSGVGP